MAEKKYANYVLEHPIINVDFGPTINMTGETDFNSDFSIGMCLVTNPGLMEEGHAHPDFDMYVSFMAVNPDNIKDLDAEIVMCMGKEEEEFLITTATTVYIPKGMWHCPLDFKRVSQPVLFVHSTIAPKYRKTPIT